MKFTLFLISALFVSNVSYAVVDPEVAYILILSYLFSQESL